MELDYTHGSRRRAQLYLGAGIVIALIAAAGVLLLLRAGGAGQQSVEMREVVAATRDIASRKPIEEGDVEMRRVPIDRTNESAFTRIDEVLGRVSSVPVAPGQLITRNLLASTVTGQTFSILEPGQEFDRSLPNLRAVSLNVPDDRAVAGLLQPGQQVDLVATLGVNPTQGRDDEQADPGAATALDFVAGPTTKVTIQRLTVLAKNGAIYILRTDVETAEKIAELTALGGQFTLVLRVDEDDRVADTEGSTIDTLIQEFDFPLPGPVELPIADGEENTGEAAPSPAPSPAATP